MILPFPAACRAFPSPSLPYRAPAQALEVMLRYSSELPGWPELPQRDAGEQGLIYSALGFPGLHINEQSSQAMVQRSETLVAIGELDLSYLENDLEYGAFKPGQAAGLDALLRREGYLPGALAVLGRLTGPVSLGFQITDEQRRPLVYDSLLFDALVRYLRLRAGWQDAQLAEKAPVEIICLEEPFLDAIGSPFLPLDWDQALAAIEEVFSGITGCRGLVAGGDLPWARLLETSAELIVVDPRVHMAGLMAAAEALAAFLDREGVVVYAIVPSQPAELEATNVEMLVALLETFFDNLASAGIARDLLPARAFVAPHGGLGSLEVEHAERVLRLTAELSIALRRRYGFSSQSQKGT